MKSTFLFLFGLCLCVSCTTPENTPRVNFSSDSPTEFTYDLGEAGAKINETISFKASCESCRANNGWEAQGKYNAQQITTTQEFSDYLIDLETTYGRAFDFTNAKYLTLRMMVPEGSYVRAMKLNFRDADGNFGGIGEIANNFPGRWGEWQTIVVDLEEALKDFRIWSGGESPLTAVTELSLNPYNANQEGPQAYYVNLVQLSNEKPTGNFDEPLIAKPAIPNQAYTFTFDDPAVLDPLMAYRVFEASNQAFATGIAGNETNAIRMRGRPNLDNIAFLPIVQQMNGQPVDFTNVEAIFFDYYLEPGGDDFDGATLYLTSEHWNDILIDPQVYSDFVAGDWKTVRLPIKDLNLTSAKGSPNILEAIYEWRLNLNFVGEDKDITMWLDNVGWE